MTTVETKRSPAAEVLHPIRSNVSFRTLWLSSLLFFSGFWAQTVVFGWLAFDLTQSAFAVALFTAARFAPMLFGPLGGLISDSWDRPRLLVVSQTFALGSAVIAAVLASADVIAYWHVLVLGFLVGLMQAPLLPARFTLIMDLVGRADLSSANALNMGANMGSRIVAPAIAGWLISRFGPGAALWFSALWYVPATILLLRLAEVRGPGHVAGGGSPLADLLAGFRVILARRELIGVLLGTVAANLCAWPVIQGFLPVFAEDVFDVGPSGLGLLFAVNGLGSLLGAVGIAALGDFDGKGRFYLGATAAFGLLLVPFALTRSFPLAVLIMLSAGVASAGFGVLQSTLALLLSPEEARGRVVGILALAIGTLPFAMLIQGAIAAQVGVVATTVGAGLLLGAIIAAIAATAPALMRVR